jgi:hypothetical protein
VKKQLLVYIIGMKNMLEYINVCVERIKQTGFARFNLEEIEKSVIAKSGGNSEYEKLGGYIEFYNGMIKLENEGIIKPVEVSRFNGMAPPLKTRWSIIKEIKQDVWPDSFIMKMAEFLDMSGYIKNPAWQTEIDKKHIERIYNFLKNPQGREYASCEERCLELFDDEKFLFSKGGNLKGGRLLSRLGITFEELKMKKYAQMFSYWTSGKKMPDKIIILENHSTFFSFKRCVENTHHILGFNPDLLVFGDGKRIVKSLEFLNELTNPQKCEIKYFGDIDPEGWLIYRSLKKRYSSIDISLFMPAYAFLFDSGKDYPIGDALQSRDAEIVEYITKEFEKSGMGRYNRDIMRLWDNRRRIPQELLTYEALINENTRSR